MKQFSQMRKITYTSLFIALGLILPFLTGQVPQIGNMLCPMHIPVLLCGFVCGWSWGLLAGVVVPLLRSFLFSMPVLFPSAVCMAFELGTYGMVAGLLHKKLPQKPWNVYVSLFSAMIIGRIVWGVAMSICMGFTGQAFGMAAFLAGAVTNAVPGILVQIVLIPVIVSTLEKEKRRT